MNPYRTISTPAERPEENQKSRLALRAKSVTLLATLALTITACTPAQQQATVKAIDDAVKCIGQNLDKSPAQIALTCGVEETPDLVALVQTIQAAKAKANCTLVTVSADAGAAKGPGL
jgi:diketogulonate reductase-like aldo/keto reductase